MPPLQEFKEFVLKDRWHRSLFHRSIMERKVPLTRKESQMSMVSNADEYIERFNSMTTRFRLKSLVNDALILTRQNKTAVTVNKTQDEENRRKRKARFRLAFRKMPKLCSLVGDLTTPYMKFRRCAVAIMRLIQVCNLCKELLAEKVKKESWFTLIDNMVATAELKQKKRGPRPFVTFVPNENRELVQLTFDIGEYRKDRRAESYMTDEFRATMKQVPGSRSPDQLACVIRAMKAISKDFNNYPLYVQKKIAQLAFLDTEIYVAEFVGFASCQYGKVKRASSLIPKQFAYNRVIVKRGLPADGYYFVLSGVLIEKVEGTKRPVEITTGQKFGEEDLICGCKRRHTVLTRTRTELLYIHRIDYRSIFDMTEDSNNPKNLEICKQHIVFQHFPMARLVENPGIWSALRYKYGRLIAKDSNDLDWIYVIKSGEARVLRYLHSDHIDMKARRKKVMSAMASQSPFHKKKQILNFIEERDYIKTSYKPNTYNPGRRQGAMSAPPTHRRSYIGTHRGFFSLPNTPAYKPDNKLDNKPLTNNYTHSVIITNNDKEEKKLPQIVVSGEAMEPTEVEVTQEKGQSELEDGVEVINLKDTMKMGQSKICMARKGSLCRSHSSVKSAKTHSITQIGKTSLPAFVQVETLHPGQVFGLRSCLDPEERGPSVSLVSGECEILQINKKFFMKHCDDAIYGLIRLKAKPFPTEEELIDRLDANLQWEEYKKRTLSEYLKETRRLDR